MKCVTKFMMGLALSAVSMVAFSSPVLWVDDASGQLGKVDVATGNVTLIGDSGVVLTDIAFDPNGNLYGISFNDLYRIDTSNGHATLVGAHGVSGGNALVFGTNGMLYAAGFGSTDLYNINPTNGTTTVVGNMGFSSAGDLAFQGSNLFLSDSSNGLVNVSSLPGTLVGSFGISNVYGLATASDNVLYGVAGTSIYSVDPTNGNTSFVSNFGGHGLGVANGESFYSEAGAVAVPEPGTLVLFLLGLGGLGLMAARRRKFPAA